jgi:hypothetical protein
MNSEANKAKAGKTRIIRSGASPRSGVRIADYGQEHTIFSLTRARARCCT